MAAAISFTAKPQRLPPRANLVFLEERLAAGAARFSGLRATAKGSQQTRSHPTRLPSFTLSPSRTRRRLLRGSLKTPSRERLLKQAQNRRARVV